MLVRIQDAGDGDGMIEIPDVIMNTLGLKIGAQLEASFRDKDGGKELLLQAIYCPGEQTVVEDRYSGGYSGAKYIAWPLPAAAIPPDSQGGDIDAGVFWSMSRKQLAGKGDTPEAALVDLERLLKEEGWI